MRAEQLPSASEAASGALPIQARGAADAASLALGSCYGIARSGIDSLYVAQSRSWFSASRSTITPSSNDFARVR